MSQLAAVLATVHGRVQGVNFRFFVLRNATALGVKGYVKNLSDGRALEVYAEGEKENLDELLGYLNIGPPRADVRRVDVKWSPYRGSFKDFGLKY
jgi:acylphosphatase